MTTRASICAVLCLGVLLAPVAGSSLPLTRPTAGAGGGAHFVPVADKKLGSVGAILDSGRLAPTTGTIDPSVGGDSVVYATSSIKCGSTIYEVSDGGKGGCTNTPNGGVYCAGNDGKNWAGASCNQGCAKPKGKGSCTVRSAD